jgi:hypothetical protein
MKEPRKREMAGVSTDFQDASSCPQREAKEGQLKDSNARNFVWMFSML